MRNKWFWLTLFAWTLLTVSVTSWALIFSPLRFDPQDICDYHTEINGTVQKTRIWRNEGRLGDLLPIITASWKKDGWTQTCQDSDLAPALLGLSNKPAELESRMKLLVFQKKGLYKSLGLWEPDGEGRTYGWVSEISDGAFNPGTARQKWDLPLVPPADAEDLFYQKIKDLKIGIFSMPKERDLVELCAAQGFESRLWRKETDGESYLIMKKKHRFLAVVETGETRKTVSLSSFEN